MSLRVSWKRSSSFFGSLAMRVSNVQYGESSAFGVRLKLEQNAPASSQDTCDPAMSVSCPTRELLFGSNAGCAGPVCAASLQRKRKAWRRNRACSRSYWSAAPRRPRTGNVSLERRLGYALPLNRARIFAVVRRSRRRPVTLPSCRIPRRRPEAASRSHQDHIDRRCQGPARAHRACTARHFARRGR
jgi:hypothetical protein